MWLRLAALAAMTAVLCIPAHAQSRAVLTLDDAFAHVDQFDPDLRLPQGQRAVLDADLERAALRPPPVAGVGVENVSGGGEASGFKRAGITLGLASVLERDGTLDAHVMLAKRRLL
ncbi:hypothetical protein [Cognatiluteimonas profundi]|uniref:hypothetical protein n=1 Tax=Cognatiluteimonas profundi TaxID=2594501 RepID=UPI00131E2CF7|nr:hypothetical protein [Lysobacter profundi]